MKNYGQDKEGKYLRAKSKVDRIRGFYGHLLAYLIVNTVITTMKVTRNLNNGESFNESFFEFSTFALWFFWGIGLAIHAFATFGIDYILGKNWEEKRIQKYMEDEEEKFNF